MVSLGLIEAVWDGSGLQGRPGVEAAREIGFERIDLVIDPLDLSDRERERAIADATRLPLPVSGTVCVALGITDFNPSVQRFHVERAKRHVEFAARVNASNMLLVIGDYVWKKEVIPPKEQWDTAVRNVHAVAQHAETHGVEIALELEPYEWAYVNSIDELARFLDAVAVPSMKANADLNHLWAQSIAPDELEKLTGRIAHAHISDTRGDAYENLPPGRGTAPLAAYYEALAAAGFRGTMAVELGPAPDGTDVRDWVTEGYEKTRELMNESGGVA